MRLWKSVALASLLVLEVSPALAQQGPAMPPDGTLIRLQGTTEVYVIQGGRKSYIPDPETFSSRGYQWQQVIEVDRAALESIPTGIPMASVKAKFQYVPPGAAAPGQSGGVPFPMPPQGALPLGAPGATTTPGIRPFTTRPGEGLLGQPGQPGQPSGVPEQPALGFPGQAGYPPVDQGQMPPPDFGQGGFPPPAPPTDFGQGAFPPGSPAPPPGAPGQVPSTPAAPPTPSVAVPPPASSVGDPRVTRPLVPSARPGPGVSPSRSRIVAPGSPRPGPVAAPGQPGEPDQKGVESRTKSLGERLRPQESR